jgi:hypothetical protein
VGRRDIRVCRIDAHYLGTILRVVNMPIAFLGRRLIFGIDWLLRLFYRIVPYDDDPVCILRVSPGRSDRIIVLSEGRKIGEGDFILCLHLWNERIGELSIESDSLVWGNLLLHRLRASLILLAEYVTHHPQSDHIEAVQGEMGFVTKLDPAQSIFNDLGFDVVLKDRPGLRFWRRTFWDNFYSYLLMWAYHPMSMQGKSLADLYRIQIWMSKERLMSMESNPVM